MPGLHEHQPAADASVADLLSELDLDPENDNSPRVGDAEAIEDSTKGALGGARSEHSTKSAEDASGNAPNADASATVTVFRSTNRALSKRYELDDGKLVPDGSACIMPFGVAEMFDASTAEKLAAIINKCRLPNAICVGRFVDTAIHKIQIVTAGHETDKAFSRTKKYFDFADGPGWCPIDADGTGADDVFGAFCTVVPALATTARVLRPSTSFGIYNAITDDPFPSSGGWHIFVLLKDQRDLARFLDALHKRCWLEGYGYIKISASGAALARSLVDTALKDPTRLIFEGGPELGPGLAQNERPAVAYAGEALDSLAACPELNEAEEREYARLVAKAIAGAKPECDRARADWETDHVKTRMAKGMPEADARAAGSRIADGGELDPLFELHFDRLGGVTVAEVLANPKKYVEQSMADPIEGVAYGQGKAKLYQHPAGQLWIKSFAHGGCEYEIPRPAREAAGDVFGDMSAVQAAEYAEKERVRAEKAEREQAARDEARASEAQPHACSGRAWRFKKFPVREHLLGTVFHRTSRWLGYGNTGAGKTLFHMDKYGAIASGKTFLDWEGSGEPKPVMYLDGEMAGEMFQERMLGVMERYPDCEGTFYGFCRDALDSREMPPLNSDAGGEWLWRKIEEIQPVAICFDNLMCLTRGNLSEEDGWVPMQALTQKLTNRRIAQSWITHTGHNKDHAYGTSMKEWAMTAVYGLIGDEKATKAARGASVKMHFDKSRERNDKNWAQFADRAISFDNVTGWASRVSAAGTGAGEGGDGSASSFFGDDYGAKPHSNAKHLRGAILDVLLARAAEVGRAPFKRTELSDLLKEKGVLGGDNKGRAAFSAALTHLRVDGVVQMGDMVLWIAPDGGMQ